MNSRQFYFFYFSTFAALLWNHSLASLVSMQLKYIKKDIPGVIESIILLCLIMLRFHVMFAAFYLNYDTSAQNLLNVWASANDFEFPWYNKWKRISLHQRQTNLPLNLMVNIYQFDMSHKLQILSKILSIFDYLSNVMMLQIVQLEHLFGFIYYKM